MGWNTDFLILPHLSSKSLFGTNRALIFACVGSLSCMTDHSITGPPSPLLSSSLLLHARYLACPPLWNSGEACVSPPYLLAGNFTCRTRTRSSDTLEGTRLQMPCTSIFPCTLSSCLCGGLSAISSSIPCQPGQAAHPGSAVKHTLVDPSALSNGHIHCSNIN